MMELTYIHHSCYLAEDDQCILVFDYWQDPQGMLHQRLQSSTKQIYFFVSHFHQDHYNPEIFSWQLSQDAPAPRHIISYDTRKRHHILPAQCTAVLHPDETYSDELLSVTAFRSTDVGVSYLVKTCDTTLFHAGDLNNWYFDTPNELLKISPDEMEGLYLSILRDISRSTPAITHVMLPIDPRLGRNALRGVTQFLTHITTRELYPMHTWEEDISSQIQNLAELFCSTRFHPLHEN